MTDFTNNNAPQQNFGIGQQNRLVMDITIPDGMNGQGNEDVLVTPGSQNTFHGHALTAFNGVEPHIEVYLDHGTVNAAYDDGEDIFRQIHNASDVFVDAGAMQMFSPGDLFYFDDITGILGDYDQDIEALIKDVDGNKAPSAADFVVKEGSANVRELISSDNVCFDGSIVDDAEYDFGEVIWYDVDGTCATFDTGMDVILVGLADPTGTSTLFGVEKEVGYIDQDNNGSYTCSRTGFCEPIIYSGVDGVNILTGDMLTTDTAFFDSSREMANGIYHTGIGWDEVRGTKAAAQFIPVNNQYLSSASNPDLQIGLYNFVVGGWVYMDSSSGSARTVLMKEDAGDLEYALFIGSTFIHAQIGSADLFYSISVPLQTWIFVGFWHDVNQGNGRLFLNGNPLTSQVVIPNELDGDFVIGRSTSNQGHWDGRIDSIFIAKPADISIISALITSLYNNGNGKIYNELTDLEKNDWGLVAWWDLDEDTGLRRDAHGNNHLTDNNNVGQNEGNAGQENPILEDIALATSLFTYISTPSSAYSIANNIFKQITDGISSVFANNDEAYTFSAALAYADVNTNTKYDDGESIYDDSGDTIGFVDQKEDRLIGMGIENLGTAIDTTDIDKVTLWAEDGTTPGFQSNEDINLGEFTVHSLNNKQWRISNLNHVIASNGLRLYVTVDTANTPTHGATIQMAIPTFHDEGMDAVADSDGDVGVFVASNNDGPMDADIVNAHVQEIDAIRPSFEAITKTIDSDLDGTIDQIEIHFSEIVTLVDNNPADGIPTLSLTDGCTIVPNGYGFTGDMLVIDVQGCTLSDTSITPTLTYTSVAQCGMHGSICDAAGNQMDNGENILVSDGAGPIILLTFPMHDEKDVHHQAIPSITFSEAIDTLTFAYQANKVPSGGYDAPLWSNFDTIVSFDHAQKFLQFETYDIEVTIADDVGGNPLAGSVVTHPFSFTTQSTGSTFGSCSSIFVSDIKINNGEESTVSPDISMMIDQQGATEIVISERADFIDAKTLTVQETIHYTLSESFGRKNLYLFLRNHCFSSGTYRTSIQYISSDTLVSDVLVTMTPEIGRIDEVMKITIKAVNEKNMPLSGKTIRLDSQDKEHLHFDQKEVLTNEHGEASFIVKAMQENIYNVRVYVDHVFMRNIKLTFAKSEFDVSRLEDIGLAPGDIIQEMGLSTLYYYGLDRKLHPFLFDKVYESYFGYFNGVEQREPGIVAKAPIGEPVGLRPGTWLIKTQDDPKVYAVLPGKRLRWIATEALAHYVYGPLWRERIIDVSQDFLDMYTLEQAIIYPLHPEGSVIQFPKSQTIYYIGSDGRKRPFANKDIFFLHQLQERFIIQTYDGFYYENGLPITQKELIGQIEY